MALIDVFQLVHLYKLRCSGACFLPTDPHPLPLSTTPPQSSVHSKQTHFKTPARERVFYDALGSTPGNLGASSRKRLEGDTDRDEGYKREVYDDYIREDLKSRVFVDFEVFLKSVLHVPPDWRIQWKPVIEAVKGNGEFEKYYKEYCRRCGIISSREKPFYQPLMMTANAALNVVSSSRIIPGNPQYYRVNSNGMLQGGVMNKKGLAPDLVVLHDKCRPSQTKGLHWANALHVLEVKPYDAAICDGKSVPRLVVDEVDPISNHALPPSPARYQKREPSPATTSTAGSKSTSSRKRASKESHTDNQQTSKKRKKSSAGTKTKTRSTLVIIDEEAEVSSTPTTEAETKTEARTQGDPAVQVCRYLLEMFSVPFFRSHATVCLVDRDRLQLYHANRSVILVSSAINFSEDDGLDKFIAVIIAFRRLSFAQNGILDTLVTGNIERLLMNPDVPSDKTSVQKKNQLELTDPVSQKEFTVTLGDLISRDPATVGRLTVVLKAESERWPDIKLVIKISWPSSGRVPENEFINKAAEKAKEEGGEWASKHLPNMLWYRDFEFGADSTFEAVASLFKDAKFVGGSFTYERRALRIIIQEELYPLRSLESARELAQVFVDIACVHRWLHDHPGILHRDLSLNNAMCRIVEKKDAKGGLLGREVYGVLTDYDLSSWVKDIKSDYTKTSQYRTGTPPYMAHELLLGTNPTHLYRHDLESLFYIMLLTCGRHTIGYMVDEDGKETGRRVVMRRESVRPYSGWFGENGYASLGKDKYYFLSERGSIGLPSPFGDFRPWLEHIQFIFSAGLKRRGDHKMQQEKPHFFGIAKGDLVPFDHETLGGAISFSSFIEPVRQLTGDLKGLAIRYDPPQSSLPALTAGTDADA